MTNLDQREKLLTFRSGGWVILLAFVLVAGIIAWRVAVIWPTLNRAAVGDGKTLESYQFTLEPLLVDRELLVPAGIDLRRDGLPLLDHPATVAAADYEFDSKLADVRILTTRDRVIGVEIDGQARAYPLWLMEWHQVANDTVADTPILVTYDPLCDSAAVFAPRVDNEPRRFSISGLLYNSNLVIYDQGPLRVPAVASRGADSATGSTQPAYTESLWSQLDGRAIAGPAAARGASLERLPAVVVPWAVWQNAHPDTTIALPDPNRKKIYRRNAYGSYAQSDTVYFPLAHAPPEGGPRPKLRIVAWRAATPVGAAEKAAPSELGAGNEAARLTTAPATRWVVQPADRVVFESGLAARAPIYAYWFAWHAFYPETALRVLGDGVTVERSAP